MNMVSVHAISLIYELRALRSRLQATLSRNRDILFGVEVDELEWTLDMIDNMIRKVERTGAYIQDLQASLNEAERAEAQARLGSEFQPGLPDHRAD